MLQSHSKMDYYREYSQSDIWNTESDTQNSVLIKKYI